MDKNAQTVARYTYDAWGVCAIVTDTSGVDIATINPFRYRGYYYDAEIGLYYLQSRYYDANIGRWINTDDAIILLVSCSSTIHTLFTYCGNNVPKQFDPYGFAGATIQAMPRPRVELCIKSPDKNSNMCFAFDGKTFTAGHVFLKLFPNKDAKECKEYLSDCSFGFAPATPHTFRTAVFQTYYPGKVTPNDTNPYDIAVLFPVTQKQYKCIYDFCKKRRLLSTIL